MTYRPSPLRSLESLVTGRKIWSYSDGKSGEMIKACVDTEDGIITVYSKLVSDVKANEPLQLVEVIDKVITDEVTRKQSTERYLVLKK